MRRTLICVLMSLVLATTIAGGAFAQAAEKPVASSYVGVAKCKMCHSSDTKGAQYKTWAASKHAKAFATLATPEAAEVAKKAGVTGNPQAAPQCLACHTTGAAEKAELRAKVKPEDGVSCESCHGPGAAYSGMDVMKAVFAGTTPAKSVGLVMPDAKTCATCHNEKSPTFKSFDFAKMKEQIKHPYPAEVAAKRGHK